MAMLEGYYRGNGVRWSAVIRFIWSGQLREVGQAG